MTVEITVSQSTRDDAVTVAAALGRVPRAVRPALRRALRDSGNVLAERARANASWSGRIPGAIVVRASFRVNREAVEVRVARGRAPHGRPYEGIRRNSSFRHPVFGNRSVWVSQATRPFLRPAAEQVGPQAAQEAREAVVQVLRDAGL